MLSLGTLLHDRYRIDRMLEIGALAAVYRATDTQTDSPVVIKELMPQPELQPHAHARLEARFADEAEKLKQLRHPQLVRVLDYFCQDDTDATPALGVYNADPPTNAYLVLEHAEGEPLAELLARRHHLREEQVLRWARQLLGVLDYCHRQGVLHRDVSPHNIIITPNGEARLTGFEVYGLWEHSDPRTWTAKRVMGAPEYAAPERWGMKNWQVDRHTDVYSLGAVLYHALTGEQPLTAEERMANPYRFLQLKPPAPHANPHVRDVILKAMQLPRDKRYPDAATMLAALDAGQRQALPDVRPAAISPARHPWRGKRSWRLVLRPRALIALLAGILVLALASWAAMRPPTWLADSWQRLADRGAPATPEVPAIRTATGVGASEVGGTLPIPPSAPRPGEDAAPATGEEESSAHLDTAPSPAPDEERSPVAEDTATLKPGIPGEGTVVFSDTFTVSANRWLTGEHSADWGELRREVLGGRYRWDVTARQAVGLWCTPDLALEGDFSLAVDAQRLSGPTNTAYGLLFNLSQGNYYLFSVRDDGYFRFSLWNEFAWQPIIDWTATLALQPGEVNRLAVVARDGSYTFYANEEFLAQADDAQLPSGECGLSVAVAPDEDTAHAVVEFDNFIVRKPAEEDRGGE